MPKASWSINFGSFKSKSDVLHLYINEKRSLLVYVELVLNIPSHAHKYFSLRNWWYEVMRWKGACHIGHYSIMNQMSCKSISCFEHFDNFMHNHLQYTHTTHHSHQIIVNASHTWLFVYQSFNFHPWTLNHMYSNNLSNGWGWTWFDGFPLLLLPSLVTLTEEAEIMVTQESLVTCCQCQKSNDPHSIIWPPLEQQNMIQCWPHLPELHSADYLLLVTIIGNF